MGVRIGEQQDGGGGGGGLLGDVAGAGRGELVGIDEESSVGITGIDRHHPVVDVLLGALALVAGGEETAGGVGGLAGFQSGSLGVVVVTVAVILGDMLEDDSPVSLNIDGPADLGVVDVGRTKVTLRSDPVGGVVGRGTLGGSGVVVVVEALLLVLGDVLHQVVGGLVGNVGVLLQEDGILADLVGDLVLGIFGIFDAEGKVGVEGALGWGFGITVAVGSVVRGVGRAMRRRTVGRWVVRQGMVGEGMIGRCPDEGGRNHQSDDQL